MDIIILFFSLLTGILILFLPFLCLYALYKFLRKKKSKAKKFGVNLMGQFVDLETPIANSIEESTGRKLSNKERENISQILSSPTEISMNSQSLQEESDDMLRQYEIEQKSHYFRMVVVSYVNSQIEPYPYKVKKNIAYIKEFHPKVLSLYNTNIKLYRECVIYEYEDMFVDKDFSLTKYDNPENLAKYKAFYQRYTEDPYSLDLGELKSYIPKDYLVSMDDTLFEL